MYMPLGEALLKSGERMQVGVVRGPDPDWKPALTAFLGHKGPVWRQHIAGALDGPLDSLETRFYVGQVDGKPIAQIMIVGSRGVGILGHVFTLPEQRQKGAARGLMHILMEDCRRQGFHILTLGTGFQSPAYWIYHGFGFRGVHSESGNMLWQAEPEAAARLFQRAPVSVRAVRWDDWGFFNYLAMLPVEVGEGAPRSALLGLQGQGSLEGPFIAFQIRREQEPLLQAQTLVSETGASVGWGLLGPSEGEGGAWRLDVHTHPHFTDYRSELMASLALPKAPVISNVSLEIGS